MHPLRAFCRAHLPWAQRTIEELAAIESPSDDKAAVDRCGAGVGRELERLGARVQTLPQEQAGDHVRGEWGSGPRSVLLLAHFDTVWPVGQLAAMPLRTSDGRLYGPGVYDMKGGLVIGLLAVRAWLEVAGGRDARVVFLCTSDEEIGSASSRSVIEREARQIDAVLVLEPALADGVVKTARKGVGEYTLSVRGVPAHAGGQPGRGASAIVELAHQVLALQALQDPARGVTLNAGVIRGGTRSNVVAEHASAAVDVRVEQLADAARIDQALRALRPVTPRTRIEVTGRINRPPMERTPGVVALYRLAQACGDDLGIPVDEGSTGGASDGNFTAALGVPTLDGLGAVGDGAHALDEHIVLARVPDCAALLAALIGRIGRHGVAPAHAR
jgi:glutamate carboxypeptidase